MGNRNVIDFLGYLAVVAFVGTCACSAQRSGDKHAGTTVVWSPPNVDWPDSLPTATVPKEMIGSLRVAGFPIVFETTKLVKAKDHFGGSVGSKGDAGDALAWLCLYGSDKWGLWALWLTSGEMDGQEEISGIEWRRLSANQVPDHRCREIPRNSSGIELPIPLHLNMAAIEVRKMLGAPTFAKGNDRIYCHEHQETVDKLPYTVDSTIGILLRGGKVWQIVVTKTTTS